jgi:hypothetical protein
VTRSTPAATVAVMTPAPARDTAEIEAMRQLAAARRDSGSDPAGWASGPGWYDGVTAALEWAGGRRADPPMTHPARPGALCTHPPTSGPPPARDIARERGAAEEHLDGGYHHGDYSPGHADGVLAAFRWLSDPDADPPAR